MAKYDEDDGVWRTINGQHIFIKEGQSPMDAFIKQTGKNNRKKEDKADEKISSEEQQITLEHEKGKIDRDYRSFNKMKENLEELKTNPKSYMDRVYGDENLTKEEYEQKVQDNIKYYEKGIKQWEEEVMPHVNNTAKYIDEYKKYLKEHPNSKMKFEDFIK